MAEESQYTPRQTLSYIRNLLRSRGLIPKNKMGQNFLIDLNLIDLIIESAELTKDDSVLEVGTGTGTLTTRLSDAAGSVLSVELDSDFFYMAREMHGHRKNLHLYFGDILAGKNQLNPGIMSKWEEIVTESQAKQRKLVANLPYVVATPVIANLLISEIPIERMVVMVQWEVAERMVAPVGDKQYASLSILMQALTDVTIVRRLGPTVFYPQPEVDSAIVCIKPNANKRSLVPEPKKLRAFLRDLYTHRRKNLRQALSGWPSGRRDKKEIDAKLQAMGIDGNLRAEGLDVSTHLQLMDVFGE